MIKRLSIYIIITIIAIIIGLVLSTTFKNLLNVYSKVKENNKKINFLDNTNYKKNIPLLCFQSAYKLSKKTNTTLPEILPLGALPLKTNNNLVSYDRYGFRNNDDVWKKNNHDLLILGDSVVVDNNISDKYIFSNNFKNKSTINLGCGGNGLLTSLYLLEQITKTNYNFKNVLFFLNFDNDLSKDTIREYNTKLFSQTSKVENKNIFLNETKYQTDYLNFVKEAFSKEIFGFSLKDELFKEFSIKKLLQERPEVKEINKNTKIVLEDGEIVEADVVPEGSYNVKTYNIFLNILERISILKQKRNFDITFVLVPTNKELDMYNSDINNKKHWDKYFNYKYLKNSIASTLANYNINIIDLYNFISENNYKGFNDGHFEKEFHSSLSNYISKSISNNTNNELQKLYYYNSFYPSKKFFNYQVNFGNTLSSQQLADWIDVIGKLLRKNIIDDYLLAPALGYLFINQECKTILKLNKISSNSLINYNVGNFYYKVCNLKNEKNINKSIKEINFLIENYLIHYAPTISIEIKKSLSLTNASK